MINIYIGDRWSVIGVELLVISAQWLMISDATWSVINIYIGDRWSVIGDPWSMSLIIIGDWWSMIGDPWSVISVELLVISV